MEKEIVDKWVKAGLIRDEDAEKVLNRLTNDSENPYTRLSVLKA